MQRLSSDSNLLAKHLPPLKYSSQFKLMTNSFQLTWKPPTSTDTTEEFTIVPIQPCAKPVKRKQRKTSILPSISRGSSINSCTSSKGSISGDRQDSFIAQTSSIRGSGVGITDTKILGYSPHTAQQPSVNINNATTNSNARPPQQPPNRRPGTSSVDAAVATARKLQRQQKRLQLNSAMPKRSNGTKATEVTDIDCCTPPNVLASIDGFSAITDWGSVDICSWNTKCKINDDLDSKLIDDDGVCITDYPALSLLPARGFTVRSLMQQKLYKNIGDSAGGRKPQNGFSSTQRLNSNEYREE